MLTNKARIILIALCLLTAAAVVPIGTGAEICVASELTVSIVQGRILLSHGVEEVAPTAEVELMEFRDDEWRSLFKVVTDGEGRFTFPEVHPGKYQLVARHEGFSSTGVYVRVKKRSSKQREIVVPLRLPFQDCVFARVQKRA